MTTISAHPPALDAPGTVELPNPRQFFGMAGLLISGMNVIGEDRDHGRTVITDNMLHFLIHLATFRFIEPPRAATSNSLNLSLVQYESFQTAQTWRQVLGKVPI
jgi:hypothetical protein